MFDIDSLTFKNLNFSNFFKSCKLRYAAILIIPAYAWIKLYKNYKSLKNEYEKKLLHHQKSNCVVMYSKNNGMSGWPPNTKAVQLSLTNLNLYFEPYLYFINTATNSLNVAEMNIEVQDVFEALIEACKRGVAIRMIINQKSAYDKKMYKKLMNNGAQIMFYVAKTENLNTIMHYKYILKDTKNLDGCVCMGSQNLTKSAFFNNYEDVIFTSDRQVLETFQENFEDCWRMIKTDNQNVFNRTILAESNLLIY